MHDPAEKKPAFVEKTEKKIGFNYVKYVKNPEAKKMKKAEIKNRSLQF